MAKHDFEFELGRNPNFITNDDYKKINENIIPKKLNFFDEPKTEFHFKEFLASVEAEKRYRLALTIASLGASLDGISEQRRHQIESEVLGKAK